MRKSTLAAALGLTLWAAGAMAQTITFRFNDPEAPQMRAALDDFEKANPGIKVEMQRISWADARDQFVREAATGAGPDVLQSAFVWPRSLGAAGALLPLDELIARTGIGVAGWDSFVSTDLAYGPDGKIYAVPFTTDTFAIVYNKDLLDAAGVKEFPTTWDGLRQASKAVLAKTGKAGFAVPAGSCGTPTIWFALNFYWWSKGLALIDKRPDGKFFMNITPEQIAQGFDYYNQFLKDGDNPRANLSICLWGAPELMEALVKGDAAIATLPDPVALQLVTLFKQRYPDKPVPFRSALHPADVNGSKTFFGGRMIAINANIDSKKLDAAWKLVQFLARPDPVFPRHYTNYVQPQQSLLGYKHLPEEIRSGFDAQIKVARGWGPYGTGPVAIPFMWNAVGRAAGSVFIGEKSSAQAAKELYDLIAAELARNQKP